MTAGIYLHIPFCKSRCSYCDFATDVYRSNDAVERYVDALCREITSGRNASVNERVANIDGTLLNSRVSARCDTIYFGGGTPSLLQASQLERILNAIRSKFEIFPDAEITVEMNPATVTPATLAAYRSLGVNRASFGVQTFDDRALKLLARGHDANDARATFTMLREAGFDNISFDLIAGLPGQTLESWSRNLDEAISMSPEHLSLYLLEIHEGTPLAEQVRVGRQPEPDDELAAGMYEMMLDRLAAAGYEQYEISNFAKPGYESRHNTKYWRLDPVYGFGVSAHSFEGKCRWSNERDSGSYVVKIESALSPLIETNLLTQKQLSAEFAFLNLRLTKGLDLNEYERWFGIDLQAAFSEDLHRLSEAGLIEIGNTRLKLTRRGMIYSNEVFSIFV